MSTANRNLVANANATLRDFFSVVRGHDAVHPDRDECGGLGGCVLLRAEHDVEREFIETLEELARRNVEVTVEVVGESRMTSRA